eukprot:1586922-Rhodomonas_salina.1
MVHGSEFAVKGSWCRPQGMKSEEESEVGQFGANGDARSREGSPLRHTRMHEGSPVSHTRMHEGSWSG